MKECSDRVDGEIHWEEWTNKSILWRLFYSNEGDESIEQIRELLEETLLISNLDQVQVNVKREKIEVEYQLKTHFPGKWIQIILGAKSLNTSNKMSFEDKESEELIRICRGVKNDES